MAPSPSEVERVDWPTFLERLDWRQGEHVALVGPTGRGKTTLALELLPHRSHTVVIASKPKDGTLARLRRTDGYQLIRRWPPRNGDVRRVLLWPRFTRTSDTGPQSKTIHHALESIFVEGGWCVFVDDVQYLQLIGLRNLLRVLWLQARSVRISVVAATQRPVHVPREMWSSSTHVFIWNTSDPDDLRSLSGFGGIDSRRVRAIVQELGKYEVLYINTRTGLMAVTRVR